MKKIFKVLTIAGSDSGGGAGIQADLKTYEAHGVFGCSVITAITAQNTVGVTAVHNIPLEIITAQMDAVFSDIKPDAVKIGMLSNADIITTVTAGLQKHKPAHIVLDPVMIAASGARLLEENAVEALKTKLIPLATLVTPNIPEAQVLVDFPIKTISDMKKASEEIHKLGCKAVLVKGGHLQEESLITDVFFDGNERTEIMHEKLGKEGHGTGCTLSSAIAAVLAQGYSLEYAVEKGIDYVHKALSDGFCVGASSVCVLNHSGKGRE